MQTKLEKEIKEKKKNNMHDIYKAAAIWSKAKPE